MQTLIYILIVAFIVLDLFLALRVIEYIYCAFLHKQPPMVASNNALRAIVADQINKYYPNAKRICEIGSGFGGLARYVSRHTNAKVVGVENMPFSAFVSWVLGVFGKSSTVWGDAFGYLRNTREPFDIGIAYLGPKLTPMLKDYGDKIRVLISLDFKMPNMKPVRTIDLGYGNTVYHGKKYPHKVFIYEF